MGSQVVDNKFTWVIENFRTLQSEKIYSDEFIIGGCKWHLIAYPKGHKAADCLSLFLTVAKRESLPDGWMRDAQVYLTIVNEHSQSLSQLKEFRKCFDEKTRSWGFLEMLPLTFIHHKDSGFLVNGELKIVAKIDVLKAIGGILDESEEATQPLKKRKQGNDGNDTVLSSSSDLPLNNTQQLEESFFEVNGFLVLPSQVETVKHIFQAHPDIASGVQTKCQHLRTTYINILLGVIQTLCQPPQELTDDDLKRASYALACVVTAGFQVDWLENNLHQVLENKFTVLIGETQLLEMEFKLLSLKLERIELEASMKQKKEEVAVAKIPLSFDDLL
ncbi:MATH domain and coiled-coil domain-containing protein At3g58370 [Eutrema salsugineum]|uniref:MATH domain and coiled-coil domain-containing protein At3g58370 n=1 Tax=Eutrema salsugineum TaxID=72664 RepID=UPI000CED3A09|nr:MATH domain and coiled-coil domain-containing protein At3g58370 [Eutrema salsugineum]